MRGRNTAHGTEFLAGTERHQLRAPGQVNNNPAPWSALASVVAAWEDGNRSPEYARWELPRWWRRLVLAVDARLLAGERYRKALETISRCGYGGNPGWMAQHAAEALGQQAHPEPRPRPMTCAGCGGVRAQHFGREEYCASESLLEGDGPVWCRVATATVP